MIDDDSPLSLEGIRAASAAGRLPDLARRLVAERRWSSIDVLLTTGTATGLGLEESAAALIALCEALASLPPGDQREAFAELHSSELRAGRALVRRAEREPLTAADRAGLTAAAALFASGGDAPRAAALYEKAGDDARAAEVWGSLGELEKMEACLARQESQQGEARRLREARRDFETLFGGGERRAAIALGLQAGEGSPDARELALQARRAQDRLCRSGAVSLRLHDGRVLRVAVLPAELGRDPQLGLALRDPTVSRLHARLIASAAGVVSIDDAGSRGGTQLAGFPIAGTIPLGETGEIALGSTCRVRFEARAGGRIVLRGQTGLDRDFWAVVGAGAIDLGDVLAVGAEASDLGIDFSSGGARLVHARHVAVRVAGQLIGPGCDLLSGDVIELLPAPGTVAGSPHRWDVL
jgi:hypothetical protein